MIKTILGFEGVAAKRLCGEHVHAAIEAEMRDKNSLRFIQTPVNRFTKTRIDSLAL
jgi:hypothetical protein